MKTTYTHGALILHDLVCLVHYKPRCNCFAPAVSGQSALLINMWRSSYSNQGDSLTVEVYNDSLLALASTMLNAHPFFLVAQCMRTLIKQYRETLANCSTETGRGRCVQP